MLKEWIQYQMENKTLVDNLIFFFFSLYRLQHDTLITSDNSCESLWANPFPDLAQLNKSNDVTADGVQLQEGSVSFH